MKIKFGLKEVFKVTPRTILVVGRIATLITTVVGTSSFIFEERGWAIAMLILTLISTIVTDMFGQDNKTTIKEILEEDIKKDEQING